jgi:hypothetical protein
MLFLKERHKLQTWESGGNLKKNKLKKAELE